MVRHFFQTLGAGPSALAFTTLGSSISLFFLNDGVINTVIYDDGISAAFNGNAAHAFATGGRHYTVVKTPTPAKVVELQLPGLIATANQADGVAELRQFTGLRNLNLGSCPLHRVAASMTGQAYLSNLACANRTLDIGDLVAGEIIANSTGCNGIIFPKANNYTYSLQVAGNRLSGALVLTALTNLQTLFVGDSGATGQEGSNYDVTSLDISLLPALRTLHINQCYTKQLLYGGNALALLTTINAPSCRFSARPEVGGNLASLCATLAQAVGLLSVNLRNGSLTEADVASLVDALYTTRNSRPSAVALDIAGQAYNIRFPTITRYEAYNAPVVNLVVQQRIYELQGRGWSIGYNRPMLRLSKVDAGHIRLEYEGLEDITTWAVGDYVVVTDTNSGQLSPGRYLVTAGSGKTWEIAAASGTLETYWTGHLAVVQAAPYCPAGLLANGDFTTASNWSSTGGWVMSEGQLSATTGTGLFYQPSGNYSSPIVAGLEYEVVFYLSRLAGGFKVLFNNGIEYNATTAGYQSFVFTAPDGDTTINLAGFQYNGVDFNGACEWIQVRRKP